MLTESKHKITKGLGYCPVDGCGLRAEGENCKISESKKKPVQHEGKAVGQCFHHNHQDRVDWICSVDGCHVKMLKKIDGFCTKHRPK